MLGAIIGDICGSIYEFNNCKDQSSIGLFGKGCFPTDDSVMTVAVAQALMDTRHSKDLSRDAIIDMMHYYGKLFPYAGYGGSFMGWLRRGDRKPYNSWGNGSAMRVSSVGWLYDTLEETLFFAKLSAEVTHNHPEGIKGAQATAAAIYMARTGCSKEEIKSYVEKTFGYDLDFRLDDIRVEYDFDVSCQGSLPPALVAFLESTDYEDSIKRVISIGGDSDTLAAICGGIAEAFYGIPEWMEKKAFEVLSYTEDMTGSYENQVLASQVRRFQREVQKK
ncbi:MAG: ADP-ribosylglycohydrolase family protein [Firmicutes bacterium]|nr:ADP-ribosylglycohydrolase family protein [Bacillota bacterium]